MEPCSPIVLALLLKHVNPYVAMIAYAVYLYICY